MDDELAGSDSKRVGSVYVGSVFRVTHVPLAGNSVVERSIAARMVTGSILVSRYLLRFSPHTVHTMLYAHSL